MKKLRIAVLISALFMLNGCGLISNLTDVTETANELLGSIDDIVRQLDAQVQNGDLEQEVADLIDDRLDKLASIIDETIQNSGGFLFDQVNGTIDNVFYNISELLDQIKKGILDDSLPALVHQLSTELQAQINLLSSNIEDIIVLTFGNTFILLDKTTNSVVIIISIILLALGLFVFALVLMSRKNRQLTAGRIIGLSFMCIYILFFLLVILLPRLRGNIIAGFNYGAKYDGKTLTPVVTNLFPEEFTVGKNDKIFIYGKHLNLIKKTGVSLNTNQTRSFTFPENTIIVKSSNRIVLGNFGSTLNWKIPSIMEFRNALPAAAQAIASGPNFIRYATEVNNRMYEAIMPPAVIEHGPVIHHVVAHEALAIHNQPSLMELAGTMSRISAADAIMFKNTRATEIFGAANGRLMETSIKELYLRRFMLPEGDYGLTVYDSTAIVESAQLISIINPPPPVVPDIYPLDVAWSGGINAIVSQKSTADILIGFAHPEQITAPFKVRVRTIPNVYDETIDVPLYAIQAAGTNNLATIRTGEITPTATGNLAFTIEADTRPDVTETNEGNNSLTKNLEVMTYVYDAVITFVSFVSTSNMDNGDSDEYHITCRASVTNYSDWSFSEERSGEPGKTFSIDKSNSYNNLRPGHMIVLYTSGHEDDSGFRDGDDGMGEFMYEPIYIELDMTSGDEMEKEYPLIAESFKVFARIHFYRRVSN